MGKKTTQKNNTDISWKIIESYFKGKHLERLVRHQIESYNAFVTKQIINTIKMFNPVTIRSEHDKMKKQDCILWK